MGQIKMKNTENLQRIQSGINDELKRKNVYYRKI